MHVTLRLLCVFILGFGSYAAHAAGPDCAHPDQPSFRPTQKLVNATRKLATQAPAEAAAGAQALLQDYHRDDDRVLLLSFLGDRYQALQDAANAEASFRAVLAIEGTSQRVRAKAEEGLIDLLLQQRRYEDLLAAYEAGLSSCDIWSAAAGRMDALNHLKRQSEARKIFESMSAGSAQHANEAFRYAAMAAYCNDIELAECGERWNASLRGEPTLPQKQVLQQLLEQFLKRNLNGDIIARAEADGLVSGTQLLVANYAELVPLKRSPPQYPREAAQRGIDGWVRMAVTVDAQGAPTSVKILESAPAGVFDASATQAMMGWRFQQPAEIGVSAPAIVVQTMEFHQDQ
jgi:TonB family protein